MGGGGEIATGGDAELAVDVARVRADRLDAHPQGERDLRVRVTALQQGQHLDLTPGQQSARARQTGACTRRRPGDYLESPRCEMDRVDHIPRLGVPAEAGARSKRERLRALDRRGIVPEQEQSCPRIGADELAHLSQLGQGADVDDRHVWTVSAQHDSDSPVLHIGSDNQETRIALDQLAQPPGEEIVEVGEDYGYGGM
jgi:hypothetical protein